MIMLENEGKEGEENCPGRDLSYNSLVNCRSK
jgi:hypothetical protein